MISTSVGPSCAAAASSASSSCAAPVTRIPNAPQISAYLEKGDDERRSDLLV
jgi:hypothetical protein